MTEHAHELHADARAHFIATMGFDHGLEDHAAWGSVTVDDYLRTGDGWPGAAALLTFADVLIGRLASHRTAPRISVTADLTVWVVGPLPADGRLELTATLVKTGQSMSVGESDIVASGTGHLVATALGTFLASPRPSDQVPAHFMSDLSDDPFFDGRGTAKAPTLAEQVGLEVLEPGLAEIQMRPDLVNATESLQGGLVALLGEVAAQTAATAKAGTSHVVDSLEVHYLNAARTGPFRAQARLLSGGRDRALARVEVRDVGRDDRLTSVILAGTKRLADRP
jgi:acyl-coenzyme A thioesterase PaaI-like protein